MVRANGHHISDAADFAGGQPPPGKVAGSPSPAPPLVESIPKGMLALRRWVIWKYEERKGKTTKVPYNARTGARAASDDTGTWSAFEDALGAYKRGGWAGIGFMLGDGFVGIDLDKCIDPVTGEIAPEAERIIRDLDSYAEKSPSGTGVHIIAKGALPAGRRRKGNVEMYDRERYFTITGNVIGNYREVAERQAEIEAVHARVFADTSKFPQVENRGRGQEAGERRVAEFVLDPNANPPFEKFDMLCEIEPKFRLSWDHKRPDFPDQSASTYDLSLATYAAIAKWTFQEVANLIIAHRRKYREDLKFRESYYGPTIAKAMTAADEYWADQAADEILEGLAEETSAATPDAETCARGPDMNANPGASAPLAKTGAGRQPEPNEPSPEKRSGASTAEIPPERRETILQALSTKFRIPLKRIIKYVGDPPRFRVETERGDIDLGSVRGLIYQANLRASLAAYTGLYLPHFEDEHWPKIARLLLQACEVIDRGDDATMKGALMEWLSDYLDQRPPHDSLATADEAREPFRHDGEVYIFTSDFRRWLNMRLNERLKQDDLTANLRAFGAVPKIFDAKLHGRQTSRSAWKLPSGPWSQEPMRPVENRK
jgi:hypothetical protein